MVKEAIGYLEKSSRDMEELEGRLTDGYQGAVKAGETEMQDKKEKVRVRLLREK